MIWVGSPLMARPGARIDQSRPEPISKLIRKRFMRMNKIALAWFMAGAFACSADAAVTNVALGAAVTLNGTFGGDQGGWGDNPLADKQTLTDGVFVPEGQQWNAGSVFWNSLQNSIDIKLSATYSINSFVVQADNNDTYRIEYRQGGNWVTAWEEVPAYGSWGLVTRPAFTLASAITTDELRFTATGGDGYYSVTEIQALAPVPEPEEWAMLLVGAGLVGFQVKRRQRRLDVRSVRAG